MWDRRTIDAGDVPHASANDVMRGSVWIVSPVIIGWEKGARGSRIGGLRAVTCEVVGGGW